MKILDKEFVLFFTIPVVVLLGMGIFNAVHTFTNYRDPLPETKEITVTGNSMSGYGIDDGEKVKINIGDCRLSDICVFQWTTDWVQPVSGKLKINSGEVFIKKIIAIENGCYYFVGGNNTPISLDSRTFGCINNNQFRFVGSVITDSIDRTTTVVAPVKTTTRAEFNSRKNVRPTFNGYSCTDDCSGHEAGYEWAENNGIDNLYDCDGDSDSFIEGCESYVEENY